MLTLTDYAKERLIGGDPLEFDEVAVKMLKNGRLSIELKLENSVVLFLRATPRLNVGDTAHIRGVLGEIPVSICRD